MKLDSSNLQIAGLIREASPGGTFTIRGREYLRRQEKSGCLAGNQDAIPRRVDYTFPSDSEAGALFDSPHLVS